MLLPTSVSKSKEVYNYSKVDTDGLSSYLYSLDHTATFLPCDVDSAWSSFKHCVSSARELFVPLATIPSSSLPKWFDSELRHELNRVQSSRRQFLQKGSPSDFQLQKLLSLDFQLAAHILTAKENYINTICSQFFTQPRLLYSHLSDLRKSSSIPDKVFLGSAAAFLPLEKAELFNSYFNSIFTHSDFKLPPLKDLPSPSTQLNHISISTSDVME
uniref:Uncharacterized protein n=1 Tax=Amphimedon queenslandica TaxID=400682 RepID=A0A1X7TJA3_AMPQE